jgi:hypothetical protein
MHSDQPKDPVTRKAVKVAAIGAGFIVFTTTIFLGLATIGLVFSYAATFDNYPARLIISAVCFASLAVVAWVAYELTSATYQTVLNICERIAGG